MTDAELRTRVFAMTPRETLTHALAAVTALIRPADDVYYRALAAKYTLIRRFLPTLVEQLRFGANVAGEPVGAALEWLRTNLKRHQPDQAAPRAVVTKPWQPHLRGVALARQSGGTLRADRRHPELILSPLEKLEVLGYRFSPRLADVGGTRFWRIDPQPTMAGSTR